MRHGDECPCSECDARRARHEEVIERMREKCHGCRLGQPFDGHCHTETSDLPSAMCPAMDERREIEQGLADGSILRFHDVFCDCPMCLQRREERRQAR